MNQILSSAVEERRQAESAYENCGFIFAATGDRYRKMALAAARSLIRHNPGAQIDLFTDTEIARDGDWRLFSRIVKLEDPWRRSKIDAMRWSRFDKTVFLDADIVVTAYIGDLFALLDRFDIAAAHDQEPNSKLGTTTWRESFPACFPQYNAGVIAYRRSEAVREMMDAWSHAVRTEDMIRDQPAFRELLWKSDLRIATLPPEYNMCHPSDLLLFRTNKIAPRIVHDYSSKERQMNAGVDSQLGDTIGDGYDAVVHAMTASDRYIAAREGREPRGLSWKRKRMLQLRVALSVLRGK